MQRSELVIAVVGFLALGCAEQVAVSRASTVPAATAPAPATTAVRSDVVLSVLPEPMKEDVPSMAPCQGHAEPASQVPYLKGQTHVHTERSYDAETPVDDALAFYAERGYDFVSITDHNHVTHAEPPDGLLFIPGVELTYNATNCEPPPRPGYLCALHANVLFLNPLLDVTRGRHFNPPFRRHRMEAVRWQQAWAADMQGLLVFNHPTYHHAADAQMLIALANQGVRFVEFFNASVFENDEVGDEESIRASEALWDEVLTNGTPVWATGADDAHHFSDADHVRSQGKQALVGDRTWVMVRAAKEPQAIREAMQRGDFYVSAGLTFSRLEMSPRQVHVAVEPRAGEAIEIRFVGAGGQVLAREQGTEACYPVSGQERYVRVVARSDRGARAWSQPMWLGEAAAEVASGTSPGLAGARGALCAPR